MSERAKARETARIETAQEQQRAQLARCMEEMPAMDGEQRFGADWVGAPPEHLGDHVGHLSHRCRGGTIMCSCGAPVGLVCFIPTTEDSEPCEICKARKIGGFRE